MKAWPWLLTAVVWLLAVVVLLRVDFIVGVRIPKMRWLPDRAGFMIASLTLTLLFLGWIVPLAVGVKRLISNRQ